MPNAKVTSAEFQRSFGRYREAALRDPVVITNHGRESLVLLSAEEYRRLRQNDRRALYAWEFDAPSLAALQAAEPPPEADDFNGEWPA